MSLISILFGISTFKSLTPYNVTSSDEEGLSSEILYISDDLKFDKDLNKTFANKKKIPLQVFRLSGIYSEENNILVRLKSGNANIINKKNHFF